MAGAPRSSLAAASRLPPRPRIRAQRPAGLLAGRPSPAAAGARAGVGRPAHELGDAARRGRRASPRTGGRSTWRTARPTGTSACSSATCRSRGASSAARDPDAILSTGAGVCVPFFWVGRLLGRRCVYVESLPGSTRRRSARSWSTRSPSESFVQWPGARLRRGTATSGSVLRDLRHRGDPPAALHAPARRGRPAGRRRRARGAARQRSGAARGRGGRPVPVVRADRRLRRARERGRHPRRRRQLPRRPPRRARARDGASTAPPGRARRRSSGAVRPGARGAGRRHRRPRRRPGSAGAVRAVPPRRPVAVARPGPLPAAVRRALDGEPLGSAAPRWAPYAAGRRSATT